jgi:4-amino-4-deoxy-L-arabinose transferase-like glycosyltransferase
LPFIGPSLGTGRTSAVARMRFLPGLRGGVVDSQERTRLLLLLIVLSALAVRTFCVVFFSGEMNSEGTEYARIAQNLLAGNGYVGMATPGTQLFFPPLFPFLIAAAAWMVGNAEVGAHMVCVVFGTLLILPVYLISRRMFGERAALVAAALTAFHPYFIMFSVDVFCELTFLTVLLSAIYSAMYAASNPTAPAFAVSGVLYGASYLLRSEALLYMFVALGCVLLTPLIVARNNLHNLRSVAGRALLIPLVFFVVASPYIAWLSMHAGQLRLEGKSPLNGAVQLKMAKGLSANEASFSVDQNLTEQGVFYHTNANTIESYHLSLGELGVMIKGRIKAVLESAAVAVVGWLSPALFALAVLGLFGRAWSPRLAVDQLHLVALLVLSIVGTFFIHFAALRFYLPVLVVFSIWAGASMKGFKSWARRSAALFGLRPRQQGIAASVVWSLAIAAVILPPAAWTIHTFTSTRGTRPVRAVAESMAARHEPLRIADASSEFAYHAGAEFVWLPSSDEATALQYLKKRQVTHLVVRSEEAEWRPYLRKWMAGDVPEGRLTAQVTSSTGEKVQIYELR